MNIDKRITGIEDMKVKLSTLWLFVMFDICIAMLLR
jgi:hypothetical protein